MSSVPGYDNLSNVLGAAYHQAARGKGKERHARDKPFDKQPIMEISRMVGPGSATGQAMKKLQEAKSMMDRGQLAAAKAEALGAINYTAAFYLLIEEAEAEAVGNKRQKQWQQQPKKEKMPEWADNNASASETPPNPEQQRLIAERIARLKTSQKREA